MGEAATHKRLACTRRSHGPRGSALVGGWVVGWWVDGWRVGASVAVLGASVAVPGASVAVLGASVAVLGASVALATLDRFGEIRRKRSLSGSFTPWA